MTDERRNAGCVPVTMARAIIREAEVYHQARTSMEISSSFRPKLRHFNKYSRLERNQHALSSTYYSTKLQLQMTATSKSPSYCTQLNTYMEPPESKESKEIRTFFNLATFGSEAS